MTGRKVKKEKRKKTAVKRDGERTTDVSYNW